MHRLHLPSLAFSLLLPLALLSGCYLPSSQPGAARQLAPQGLNPTPYPGASAQGASLPPGLPLTATALAVTLSAPAVSTRALPSTPIPSPTFFSTLPASPAPSLPTPTPTPLPPSPRLITHGDRSLPYLALTFDLCQKPQYPAGFDQGIFAALVSAQVPATFFVGGDWARTHPDELAQLAGVPYFELGNHSWTHPDLPDLDEAGIREQIVKTQELLLDKTGRAPRLFRLPAGLYTPLVLDVIARQGLYTIQWDVVTADPVPNNQADNINRIVRTEVENGSIIIMHANGRGWHTAEALPEMIAYLRAEGYTLVTVSQLLGLEPVHADQGGSNP